jgi:hypothetical protein
MTSKTILAKIKRMEKLEERGRKLAAQLAETQSKWYDIREGEFLESDEYRAHSAAKGTSRHYNWGDVIC